MTTPNEYIKINCIDCRLKSKPFQKLTNDQMHKVDEHRTELTFKKGELLSKQGMFMSHIIYIRKGFVKCLESKEEYQQEKEEKRF